MSKFFNETLKVRSVALRDEKSKDAGFQELVETALTPVLTSRDLGSVRVDENSKSHIPITNLLQAQFKGSDSVEAVLESYRALRTRLLRMRTDQGLRSIIITSASQGEGKTFTSLNLASCCAQLQEMRVLLIDGDIRSRGLSRNLALQSGIGLSEVLAGQGEPENAILATDIPNLYLMSAGSPSMPSAELFASRRWQDLIEWSHESFNLVLVDSPPILDLADVELMNAVCDGVLMVVRAHQTKRDTLQKSSSQIDPKKLLGVIYNAAENASNRYRYYQAVDASAK
jgi:protein-tyrosine kinase